VWTWIVIKNVTKFFKLFNSATCCPIDKCVGQSVVYCCSSIPTSKFVDCILTAGTLPLLEIDPLFRHHSYEHWRWGPRLRPGTLLHSSLSPQLCGPQHSVHLPLYWCQVDIKAQWWSGPSEHWRWGPRLRPGTLLHNSLSSWMCDWRHSVHLYVCCEMWWNDSSKLTRWSPWLAYDILLHRRASSGLCVLNIVCFDNFWQLLYWSRPTINDHQSWKHAQVGRKLLTDFQETRPPDSLLHAPTWNPEYALDMNEYYS